MTLAALMEQTLLTPCQGTPDDLWFAERPADLEQAKALCLECPIQTDCLAGALERREPWGVWGGELFEGGRVIPRKVPRGRPRKDDPRHVAAAAARAELARLQAEPQAGVRRGEVVAA